MICKYIEHCTYKTNSNYVENICERNPEGCLIYRWKTEGQDIHKVLYPKEKKGGLISKLFKKEK